MSTKTIDTSDKSRLITTTLHYYCFPSGLDPRYIELVGKLTKMHLRCFHVITQRDYMNKVRELVPNYKIDMGTCGGEVKLEPQHLFADQWNGETLRLHDWYEVYDPQLHNKVGYWLEQTEEMAAYRRDWFACGYCGEQYHKPTQQFCGKCLDSSYLEKKDLHLLRLLPVNATRGERGELSSDELAALLPLYIERQTQGKDSRAVAKREAKRKSVIADCAKEIEQATIERDGFLWFLDRNVNVDNLIYYPHANKFSFGWQQPVSAEVESALLEIISEFPFQYEIKSVNGVKTNYVNAEGE